MRISSGRIFIGIRLILPALVFLAWTPFYASNARPQQQPAPATPPVNPHPGAPITAPPYPTIPPPAPQRTGLNIVVLDPAHGGTDPGARGAQGVRESDLVLELTSQVRRALEAGGFQVLQTRSGNENPSFDDRSTLANGQRGAVFVTLHVSSTGLPGTARVYAMPEASASFATGAIIPWDRAQAPYVTLSRKFADAVQGQLAQRFKGSPSHAESATIRQLRTTAAPAIAVELASVSVQDRADLERMMPGVADAIARGLAEFRPSYVLPGEAGAHP
ncbi:MAG TPA: N-acetylmuramoyl-L-alanine amidase [Candidatus Acidoferrum sp.]